MSQQFQRTKLNLMVDFLGTKKTTEVNITHDIEYIKDIVNNLLTNDEYKFDYQNAYTKIYNICLTGLTESLYNGLVPVMDGCFTTFQPRFDTLDELYAVINSIKSKFYKISGLFLTINDDSRFTTFKDGGLSFTKMFVFDSPILTKVNNLFFEELKKQRELYISNGDESCNVNNIKTFLGLVNDAYNNSEVANEMLTNYLKKIYELESAEINKSNGFVEYYSDIQSRYQKEYTFLNNVLGVEEKCTTACLNLFSDLYIVKYSGMLLSESIFVSMTLELYEFSINDKYLIDYVYDDNNNKSIVDNLYKMYLNQTLMSQIYQIDTQNIKNRRDYVDVISNLTNTLLKIYAENLSFVEEKLKSRNNYVNNSLKLILVEFYNDLINNDNHKQLNVEQNKWFMILIKYIDLYINSNREGLLKNIDTTNITLAVKILDGLPEQRFEEFVAEYNSLLNKRLLSNNGTNIELEQAIVQIMDINMNSTHGRNREAITRMGLRINDYIHSKRNNEKFTEGQLSTDVKVLNQFLWNDLVDNENYRLSNIAIPGPLLDYINKFESFYKKTFSERNIKWLYQYWQIDFDYLFSDKVITLSMPFVSTIIFYHLIENEYVSVKMLKQLTNLPTKQIVQNLITFSIKYDLIIHLDKNKELSSEKKAINEGDYFTINNEFSSENTFVKVNVISITRKEGAKQG